MAHARARSLLLRPSFVSSILRFSEDSRVYIQREVAVHLRYIQSVELSCSAVLIHTGWLPDTYRVSASCRIRARASSKSGFVSRRRPQSGASQPPKKTYVALPLHQHRERQGDHVFWLSSCRVFKPSAATRSAETASTSLNSSAFLNLRQNARMSSPPYPAAAVLDAFALWPEGLAPGGTRLAAADGAPTTGSQK